MQANQVELVPGYVGPVLTGCDWLGPGYSFTAQSLQYVREPVLFRPV